MRARGARETSLRRAKRPTCTAAHREIKSQLMFGSEWGSLMEGDAKPGATIEDEIARKKAQLRK